MNRVMAPLTAAHMPLLAKECQAYFAKKGLALDLTPGSLRVVDTYIANLRPLLQKAFATKDPRAEAEFDRNCQWLSGYVGEVIRIETAGLWSDARRLPTLDLGEPAVAPLSVVSQLLGTGRADVGGLTVETTVAFCELASRMQMAWLERAVVGSSGSVAALKSAMGVDPQMTGWLVNQLKIAVQTARLKWKKSLDFSPNSLKDLEEILDVMYTTCKSAGPGHGPSDEQISAVCKVWGPYVGEVMRRSYGGKWAVDKDGLLLSMGEATVFPLNKVRKRILHGSGDSIPFYFQATGKVLSGAMAR
jgi:hypothetical protein